MVGYGKLISAAQQVTNDIPAPTPAPVLVRDADARKRQATTSSSTTFTVTKAPDSTCGYLSGSPGVAITCENKKTCLWEAQYVGAVFCGFEDSDPSYLRCFEREAALNPTSCNDVCQSNSFNLLCTNTASPYCRTYAYPEGVKDYRCAATPVTGVQSVLHTYSDQNDRTLTVSILNGAVLSPTGASASASVRSRTASSSAETLPTGTRDGAASTSTVIVSPTNPSEGSSSAAPIGAIVGGVVGGLAVLGLLILGAFFLIRRNKKNQDLNATQPGGPPPNQQYPYGGAPPPMQQQQQYGNVPPSESMGPVSPTSTYDPTFKGHGSVSMASAIAPGQNMTQDEYNRMSYAPPMYQQGGSPPPQQYQQQQPYPQQTPSPPVAYQQPVGGYPPVQQQQQQGYGPPQAVHEIGTVADQHRGQVHEVS